MNGEKPKKRLVGWTRYVMTLLDKGLGYSAATITVCGGLVFLLLSCTCFWLAAHKEAAGISLFGAGAVFVILGMAGLSCGKSMLENANKVEPVELITRHNTGHLPEVETLVRGSDRPETAEQAELLRAVRQRPEAQPEQLLRATNENQQDV
ncbi:MAG: hypothetical protein JWL77_4166 [Chthonomonadaceae bacterium]|nr:hypothetical protein [Chthonomonadaceae bacterium]